MDWRITDAEEWMLPQLEELEKLCFSLPWTIEQLRSQLPDEHHIFLTALEGEHLLGYVGMMYVLDEGYISNVAVAPEARRKGIGDALIEELMRRARLKCARAMPRLHPCMKNTVLPLSVNGRITTIYRGKTRF